MSDLQDAIGKLPEVRAVVFDLDHTLHQGFIAASIYRGILHRPKMALKATMGIFRGAVPALFTFAGKAERVKKLMEVVSRWSRIPKPLAFMIAEARIRTKPIYQSRRLLEAAQRSNVPVFLMTNGPDIGPLIYSKIYNIRDWIANPVIYDGQAIEGFDMVVRPRNISQKVKRLLALHDLRPQDCMVVADNSYYIPLMKEAKFAVASPLAKGSVRKICDYCL